MIGWQYVTPPITVFPHLRSSTPSNPVELSIGGVCLPVSSMRIQVVSQGHLEGPKTKGKVTSSGICKEYNTLSQDFTLKIYKRIIGKNPVRLNKMVKEL